MTDECRITRGTLAARDGEIGTLKEVYFDDQAWVVRYLVVHMGGRFPGREVLITPQSIESVDEDASSIVVSLTRGQVENSPPVSSERPVSRHYEADYQRYYGLESYWQTGPIGALFGPGSIPLPATPPREPEHPHRNTTRRRSSLPSTKPGCSHITAGPCRRAANTSRKERAMPSIWILSANGASATIYSADSPTAALRPDELRSQLPERL